jgi:hypothetical protein
MAKRDPYPLQWPQGWKRTGASHRLRSRFGHRGQVSFAQSRSLLLAELERLGAANVVLTSDLPVRGDGLPYANGRAEDPGIAVWFVLRGHERVFACDRWLSHAENMLAIAKTVEAMRGMDRWGMADVVNRAFSGFAALPAGDSSTSPEQPRKRGWWEVFDIATNIRGAFPANEVLAIVKARHRIFIKAAHPDAGGSHERAAALNAALAEAEAELSR